MTDYLRHAKGGWHLFPRQFTSATWELPAHHFGSFDKNILSRWLPILLYSLLILAGQRNFGESQESV